MSENTTKKYGLNGFLEIILVLGIVGGVFRFFITFGQSLGYGYVDYAIILGSLIENAVAIAGLVGMLNIKRWGLIVYYIYGIFSIIYGLTDPNLGTEVVHDCMVLIIMSLLLFLKKDGHSAWSLLLAGTPRSRNKEIEEPETLIQKDNNKIETPAAGSLLSNAEKEIAPSTKEESKPVDVVLETETVPDIESENNINAKTEEPKKELDTTNEVKTEENNVQHTTFNNKFDISAVTSKLKFLKNKYVIIAIVVVVIASIAAVFMFNGERKAGEYVYVELNHHQYIIHSDMNCSNIEKGTKPMKTSYVKQSFEYYNYFFCPKCTDTNFIKFLTAGVTNKKINYYSSSSTYGSSYSNSNSASNDNYSDYESTSYDENYYANDDYNETDQNNEEDENIDQTDENINTDDDV